MGIFGGGGDDVSVNIGGDSSDLQNAVRQGQQSLSSLGSTVGGLSGPAQDFELSWGNLGRTMLGNLGTFGQTVIVGNQLLGMLGTLLGPIEQVAEAALHFGEQIAEWGLEAATEGVQALAEQIQNLGEQMFELNNQTEKNVYSWSYTYGQGMSRTAAIMQAQNMAAWTGQFSMNVPFTRQDLMTAISGASLLGNAGTIEKYLPMIADLAATHVNPMTGQPVSLGEAVQAIRGEKMGLSRMLKYQLGINPEDLIKYGLDATATSAGGVHINDPNTLLPALQAYSEANGWTKFGANGQDIGAAYNTAHATFWGAQSSLEDRVQNWLLRAGGMDMSGNTAKGSFFGSLKKDLNDISDWIDKHQKDLNHLADLIGNVFGGGVKVASDAVRDLAEGLHASGVDTLLENLLGKLGGWLNSADLQKTLVPMLHEVGLLAGNLAGGGIQSGIKAIQGLFEGFQMTGGTGTIMADLNGLGQWLSDPQHQAALKTIGSVIGQMAGGAVENIGTVIQQFVKAIQGLTPQQMVAILGFIQGLETGFMLLGTTIADATPIMADFFRLFEDFTHGNGFDIPAAMGQLKDDLGHWKDDMGGDIKQIQAQFNDLTTKAYGWGSDFVNQYAAGMNAHQETAKMAAQHIALAVSRYLHQSTPDEGPLAGDDRWGSELVQQYADSMVLMLPHLRQAAQLVASTAAGARVGGLGGPGGPHVVGGGASYSTAYSTNYGDTGVTLNLYGASAQAVLGIVAAAQAQQGRNAHLLTMAPGAGGALAGGPGVLGAFGA